MHSYRSFCIHINILVALLFGNQTASANYTRLGTAEGLSNSTVTSILRDSSGYLWIGTFNGLNRFNGTSFQNFHKEKNNSHSIAGNEIKCLYLDAYKQLWIGTANGLSLFDPRTEQFTNFKYNSADTNTISHNNISQIVGTSQHLWVSTSKGLNRISLKNFSVARFDTNNTELASNEIQDLAFNGNGALWVAHYNHGIDYLNTKTFSCTHFCTDSTKGEIIPSNTPESILCTDSSLWVGFENGTIITIQCKDRKNDFLITPIKYDLPNANIISISKGKDKVIISTDQFGAIEFHKNNRVEYINLSNGYNLTNNKIWCVFEDQDEILWVGHYRGGISQIDNNYSQRIQSASIESANPHAKIVSAIAEVPNGQVLVGTDGGGLFYFNTDSRYTRYPLPQDLDKSAILCIYNYANSVLLGTYMHGMAIINDDRITIHKAIPDVPHIAPSGNDIRDILWHAGKLWLADHANMLNSLDLKTGRFEYFPLTYPHPENGTVFPSPWCIEPISDSSIAIGTNRGLLIFNIQASTFEQYFENKSIEQRISSNTIHLSLIHI